MLAVKRTTTTLLVFGLAAALPLWAPTARTVRPEPSKEKSLKGFLQHYDDNPISPDKKTTRYAAAFIDLNGDGKNEVIVYLMASKWCGSGGCTVLILIPQHSGYRVMTRMTVTQLPIRVLSTKTAGWQDLGVRVQGGGIQPGYEAILRFNGTTYPRNPSMPPAQRLRRPLEGRVVIPAGTEGRFLYR